MVFEMILYLSGVATLFILSRITHARKQGWLGYSRWVGPLLFSSAALLVGVGSIRITSYYAVEPVLLKWEFWLRVVVFLAGIGAIVGYGGLMESVKSSFKTADYRRGLDARRLENIASIWVILGVVIAIILIFTLIIWVIGGAQKFFV